MCSVGEEVSESIEFGVQGGVAALVRAVPSTSDDDVVVNKNAAYWDLGGGDGFLGLERGVSKQGGEGSSRLTMMTASSIQRRSDSDCSSRGIIRLSISRGKLLVKGGGRRTRAARCRTLALFLPPTASPSSPVTRQNDAGHRSAPGYSFRKASRQPRRPNPFLPHLDYLPISLLFRRFLTSLPRLWARPKTSFQHSWLWTTSP